MRIRPDKVAAVVFSAALAFMAIGVVALIITIIGGERVQMPVYYLLSVLANLVVLCVTAEIACLIWSVYLTLAPGNRPASPLVNVLVKSAFAGALLVFLEWTRLIWIAPVEYAFFQTPVISPSVFVAGRLWQLSPAQGLGAGILFYGGIALGWVAAAILPLVRSASRGPVKRTLREDLRRQFQEK
jgi:hypothetical protein